MPAPLDHRNNSSRADTLCVSGIHQQLFNDFDSVLTKGTGTQLLLMDNKQQVSRSRRPAVSLTANRCNHLNKAMLGVSMGQVVANQIHHTDTQFHTNTTTDTSEE